MKVERGKYYKIRDFGCVDIVLAIENYEPDKSDFIRAVCIISTEESFIGNISPINIENFIREIPIKIKEYSILEIDCSEDKYQITKNTNTVWHE